MQFPVLNLTPQMAAQIQALLTSLVSKETDQTTAILELFDYLAADGRTFTNDGLTALYNSISAKFTADNLAVTTQFTNDNARIVALQGRDAAQQAQLDAIVLGLSKQLPYSVAEGGGITLVQMFADALVANNEVSSPNTQFVVILSSDQVGKTSVTMPDNTVVSASFTESFVIRTDANGAISYVRYIKTPIQEFYEWASHYIELLITGQQEIFNVLTALRDVITVSIGRYQAKKTDLAARSPFGGTFPFAAVGN